jgi:hypothetical protein
MNRSKMLRILCALGIVAVLALAGVGLEHIVAALSQASGRAATVATQPTATVTVAPPPPVQVQVVAQPTATATVAPAPTATATVAPPPPVQVQVEGLITAVDPTARTITVQDDDGGPATVVALGAARGPYYVWQKVKVYGTVTSAGSNGATVQAQFIRLKEPEASESVLAPPGATIKVEGRIIAVNAAAGTITVQDDDDPPIVVALGAARGPYYVWQKVKVYGTVTSAGSNGARVQAQFIRVKSWDGDDDD